jgi:predicted PurR-regulated permease PerM
MNSIRGWLIGAAVVTGAVLIWDVLSGALSALLLMFTAVLFSAGLRPIVDRMAKRMPYGVAVGLAFIGVITVVVVIGAVLIQPLGAELIKFVQSLPGYANALQTQLAAAQRYFENDQMARQIAGALAGSAGNAASAIGLHLLNGTALAATAIGNGVLILLLAIGWMLSSDELARFVLSLMPPATRSQWHDVLDDIGTRLSAYVGGVVINGSIVGVVMGVSLAILGVPYYLLLGFIAAVFQAIPMLGAVISGPIILLVVLATSGWVKMLIALAIFTIVQVIDQNVLSPIIFGQRVQLSFLLIILATVVGGTLLGIGGAFLAVPAAAVLQVLVTRIVAPAIRTANEQK